MILYLNLLPKTERREIRFAQFYHLFEVEIIFLLILLIVISGVIFSIKINLETGLENIEILLERNKEINKLMVAEAETINQSVADLQSVQSGFDLKSLFLLKITQVVPTGIRLTSLTLTADNYTTLEGSYAKRDDLLEFKANLLDGFLTDLDFPISNLLLQESGNFVIRGYVP